MASILAVAGCHNGSQPRAAVEGNVKYKGQPLASGSILFIPMAGTRGPETGTQIIGGRYELESDTGPPPGKLRVEIRQAQELPPDLTLESSGSKYNNFQPPANGIPPQFNERSTLWVEAVTGKVNRFDFDLQPARTPKP